MMGFHTLLEYHQDDTKTNRIQPMMKSLFENQDKFYFGSRDKIAYLAYEVLQNGSGVPLRTHGKVKLEMEDDTQPYQ